MKVEAHPNWLSLLNSQARNSVTVNNMRISEGSDEILINPAFERVSDEEIWSKLEKIFSGVHMTSTLTEIEESNRAKFGPRSIAVPWGDRKDNLFSSYVHGAYETDRSMGKDAQNVPANVMRVLRPTSADTAIKSLIPNSSAGLPYMRRKGKALPEITRDYHAAGGGYWPSVLFTRTQESKKTRDVWGISALDVIDDSRFFIPWKRVEQQFAWRAALRGPDYVDDAITSMIYSRRNDEVLQTVDFSAYDASISPEMSWNAFSFIGSWFHVAHGPSLEERWERMATVPIYTPDGEISGWHGVPSGTPWTNSIDSIVQMHAAHTFMEFTGQEYQVQGDDGIYLIPAKKRDGFLKAFSDFGLKINEDKSSVGEDEGIYLQRYYHPEYHFNGAQLGLGGVYALTRAALRIKYLERWTDFTREGIEGSDFFSLRTVMILENCKHHPGFEEFVRTVRDWDRYGLRFTSQGADAFSRMQQSRARAGLYGASEDFKGGLESFETMRVLRKG